MTLTLRQLHPLFAAEVSPVDLAGVHDEATLGRIRAAMDEHTVLVFHDQPLTDEEHPAFAQRLDGQLQFVYRHRWRAGDLVIWDNRATMHRARPFDDARHRRELHRVTTLDVEPALSAGSPPR